MTIALRPKQERVVGEAREMMRRKVSRILVQAPCGFGKTVLGSYMVLTAQQRGHAVMFMTHRDELAKQASRTMKAFGIDHGFIMSAFTPAPHKLVQIAMIDTLRNRLDKVKVPKLLIVDECHHAVSASWRKVIDFFRERGTIVIGLSATPQRLDGRPLNDIFDEMVLGPSVKELIADGSLASYVYYAPPQVAELDQLGMKYGDFDKTQQAMLMDKPKVFGDAIAHYKSIMPGKRAIAFNVTVDTSKHFVEQCIAAGIPAAHVDGEMPRTERAAAIKSFEDGHTLILSNCSLFGEGFDVRACDGVILLRKTASLSLFIQMCGRAMRPHESKEHAIILDHVGNILLHGLPDDDHEWTLEGKKKSGRKKKGEDGPTVRIRQCPKCFMAHEPSPTCPSCGHVYEMSRDVEQVDTQLQKVTPEMANMLKIQRRREIGALRTLAELEAYAKTAGYSKGWAWHTFNSRAKKRA